MSLSVTRPIVVIFFATRCLGQLASAISTMFSLLVSVPISSYFSRTHGYQVSSGLSAALQVRWQGGRVSSGVLLWLTQMAPGCVAQSIFCRSG